jgi:hypothetical protein
MTCNHQTTTNLFLPFCGCDLKKLGACNVFLKIKFQDLSNGILHIPKILFNSGWSKELQPISVAVIFDIVFY